MVVVPSLGEKGLEGCPGFGVVGTVAPFAEGAGEQACALQDIIRVSNNLLRGVGLLGGRGKSGGFFDLLKENFDGFRWIIIGFELGVVFFDFGWVDAAVSGVQIFDHGAGGDTGVSRVIIVNGLEENCFDGVDNLFFEGFVDNIFFFPETQGFFVVAFEGSNDSGAGTNGNDGTDAWVEGVSERCDG